MASMMNRAISTRTSVLGILLLCSASTLCSGTDTSELVREFSADRQSVRSFFNIPYSKSSLDRTQSLLLKWQVRVAEIDFDALDIAGQVDCILLDNRIRYELRQSRIDRARWDEIKGLLPFAPHIANLEEARWSGKFTPPPEIAKQLTLWTKELRKRREKIEEQLKKSDEKNAKTAKDAKAAKVPPISQTNARRAARVTDRIRSSLRAWFTNQNGYLPEFGWWVKKPHADLEKALNEYAKFLRDKIGGGSGGLVGQPIGAKALASELELEMLAYNPKELLKIAQLEFAWCKKQQLEASRKLGHKDDWRAALDHVKKQHVAPGEMAKLVFAQASDVIKFLDKHELVTVPRLCRDTYRYSMISEQGQKTLPYAAYGGQQMMVAYAVESMSFESKMMSMRGNNKHFSRIVTPHELIPGHHLQGYMASRYNTHRREFRTPFLVEGWALHWEMLLWDLDYPQSPEDRLGMLFWRMHRCARIIVSLKFHLGQMKPQEMIDFLIDEVGHEKDGATSEVRRYIGDSYGPLYQCAYMLGGLQLRALHRDLVGGKKMSNREFHDAVLRENVIPIEAIRASLLGKKLSRDFRAKWRFYGPAVPAPLDL